LTSSILFKGFFFHITFNELWIFYPPPNQNKGPFGLGLFLTYVKQLMQINKLLYIIHEFVNVVYEKTVHEDAIIVNENLKSNIKTNLFA